MFQTANSDEVTEQAQQPTESRKIELPPKLAFLFKPYRYKIGYGGRGSAKSWTFASAMVMQTYMRPIRCLCAREYQKSIAESVHHLLEKQIDAMKLRPWFDVQQQVIRSCTTGSEIVFSGLKTNPAAVKSMEGIDIAWVEEAEKVSDNSWEVLIPTVRKPGSEIWVSMNPDLDDDPSYKRFVLNKPPRSCAMMVNWRDNPWFPEELREEMEYLKRVDYDAYLHVWEGQTRKNSKASILGDKCIVDLFEPGEDWQGPYYGVDWGFSVDPTVMVRCWVYGARLFVEYEAYGHKVELDALPKLFDQVPGSRTHTSRADSARPETISYMQNPERGFPRMEGVEKWKGSVEDGITRLRSFEQIVIHPRCPQTAQEAKLWSWKVDKLSGDVLPEVVDKHNHCWDAVRYAINPIIKIDEPAFVRYMREQEAITAAAAKAETQPEAST